MALIAVPTIVAVVLGALRIAESTDDYFTHQRVENMAALGEATSELAHALGQERLLTVAYLGTSGGDLGELEQHQEGTVDALVRDVQSAASEIGDPGSPLAEAKINALLGGLDGLEGIREGALASDIAAMPTISGYRSLITTVLSFTEEIGIATDDPALTERARSLSSMAQAREELSYEASLMLNAMLSGFLAPNTRETIIAVRSSYEGHLSSFEATASEEDSNGNNATFNGITVSRMSTMQQQVINQARLDPSLDGVISSQMVEDYREAADKAIDSLHDSEVELGEAVTGDAETLKGESLMVTIRDSAVVLFVIVAVFLLTLLVARSLVAPLRTLRDSALRVANNDLPVAIHRMRESGDTAEVQRVTSVGVDSADEIGEVARSFDEVHHVALRLASDEAALRSNVNAMFVNLSRRSQTLVERQLRLIEGLERGEQDSERLGDLFQLDHLATRMRRNNENLLVLSGQDNTRKWSQPVPLVDVLRGAVSEVEHYDRVNVRASSQLMLHGRPVNDIIHLVAELLENATAYSAHETQVAVVARELDGGDVQVEITDSGIGMAEADLDSINERLASPPVIDVAVSRRMGLFVVSHLAARHHIHVRLHPAHNGGITAVMVLPGDLFSTGGGRSALNAPATSTSPGVPDTYAEAAAAFAASPAPAEPADPWQPGDSGTQPEWERETRHALPRRQSGETPRGHEPAPSGEDLWDTRRNNGSTAPPPPSGPRFTGPLPILRSEEDEAGRDVSAPEPPEVSRPAASPHDAWQPAQTTQPPQPERPAGTESAPWQPPTTEGSAQPHSAGATPAARPDATAVPNGADNTPAGTSGPAASSNGWNRPPEEANEPLRAQQPTDDPDSREGYGSTTYLSRRAGGGWRTVVPPAPHAGSTESLPIFDAVESNWFRRRTVRPASAPETGPFPVVQVPQPTEQQATAAPADEPTPPVNGGGAVPQSAGVAPTTPEPDTPEPAWEGQAGQQPGQGWHSEADAGWRAAMTASEPEAGGLTAAGLPKRIPRANLVPGAAPTSGNSGPQEQPQPRSADKVRNRLSGLQEGIQRGRSDTTGGHSRDEER
ncbi:sensor histidine kinase [Spiractinospora alimapuensis]|uniref:sensor histidine kinase n=1 Tax=Spiractinospora alimapuensis TaxID=2820884 RepID=UPI001F2909A7|nr:nitrate- and nitrite sensing domain-containing protein [Spiractinospora alimapuensis]